MLSDEQQAALREAGTSADELAESLQPLVDLTGRSGVTDVILTVEADGSSLITVWLRPYGKTPRMAKFPLSGRFR